MIASSERREGAFLSLTWTSGFPAGPTTFPELPEVWSKQSPTGLSPYWVPWGHSRQQLVPSLLLRSSQAQSLLEPLSQQKSPAPSLEITDPLGAGEGETLPMCVLQLDFYRFSWVVMRDNMFPNDKHFGWHPAQDTGITYLVHV